MRRVLSRIIGTGLLFLLIMTSAGCSVTDDEKYSSLGVDNEIAGFLFNFDQRDVTSRMVNDGKKGIYPVKVRWAYGENLKVDEKTPEFVSDDPDNGFVRVQFGKDSADISFNDMDEFHADIESYIKKALAHMIQKHKYDTLTLK